MGAITGFFWYTVYDSYLEREFKEDYLKWREESPINDSVESIVEEDNIMNIEQVQQIWSKFGPISIIIGVITSSVTCGMVFYCFRKFKNNLIKYEESPNNPGNEIRQ